MSVISDLDKIEGNVLVKLLDVVMLIVPGIAVIYRYNIHLIYSLDILKLLALSIAITLPLFFIMFLSVSSIAALSYKKSDAAKDGVSRLFDYIFLSLGATDLILYFGLLISYFHIFTFRSFVIGTLAVASSVFIFCFYIYLHISMKKIAANREK